jgi:hypothetical protein
MTTPAPKLVCAQCGYENEPERVYCHNCGTKLDRSVLPRETVTQQESLTETRRRIKKLTSPGQWKTNLKSFLNSIIAAAFVAAVYLFMMPPRNLPTGEANIISGDIDMAVESPQSVRVQATGADISQHFKTRVKGVQILPLAEPKGTFASLNDGKITLGAKQDLLGYPLYSTIEYQPTFVNGVFHADKVGMHFGRLGIPPMFTKFDAPFAKLWAPFKGRSEQKLVEKAKAISITKDRAILVTKP